MKLQEVFRQVNWKNVRKVLKDSYYPEKERNTAYEITDGRKLTLKEFRAKLNNSLEGYEYVFNTCLKKRPRVKKDGDWRICIKCITDDFDGTKLEKSRWDVYATNGKTNRENNDTFCTPEREAKMREKGEWREKEEEYANSPTTWALDLTSWSEWMGMGIEEESYKTVTPEEFVAHCLWEMTFFGFHEYQQRNMRRTLNKRLEDVKSGKAKLIPWEEVKESLNEKIKEKKNGKSNKRRGKG